MLGSVAKAYVPANASKEMRREAHQRGYSVLSAPFQRGLLQAVQELTGDGKATASAAETKHGER